MTGTNETPKIARLYMFLAFALLAGSIGPICVRFAFGYNIPADVITTFRLLISVVVVTPYVFAKHYQELRAMPTNSILLALTAGSIFSVMIFMMALSLEHIGVMINQVLIGTSPIWVALLEVTVLKANLNRYVLFGIFISFLGGLLIAISSSSGAATIEGGNPTLGVILAIAGAMGASMYLIIGRKVRETANFIPYIWLVYTGGTVMSMVIITLNQTSLLGYDPRGYFWVILLSLLVQIYAHGTFNYILKYMSATTMSVAGQSIPVMSAVWAILFFAEFPSILQIIGSIIIIMGVTMVINAQNQARVKVKRH